METLNASVDGDPEVTYTNAARTRAIGPAYLMIPGAVIMVRGSDGSLDERRIGATVDPIRVGQRIGPWFQREYRTADLVADTTPPAPATVQRRGAGAASSWNIPGRDRAW